VSRQQKQLEDILSVQLIQRTTRQFNLTYAGLRCYQQVKQLLEGAEQINEQVMANEIVSGKLRLAASASFGAALLSQTLIEFRLQHPQVSVEVIFTEAPLD
ncbi:LysR family transcriptional regulator, partial [Vibrio parahaemolyticus]|nr:LysR family transcriptional regulator [Vibrio parahaemolyticus]